MGAKSGDDRQDSGDPFPAASFGHEPLFIRQFAFGPSQRVYKLTFVGSAPRYAGNLC